MDALNEYPVSIYEQAIDSLVHAPQCASMLHIIISAVQLISPNEYPKCIRDVDASLNGYELLAWCPDACTRNVENDMLVIYGLGRGT